MNAADIRARFLSYFERNGHAVRPSSSLVPSDDPTLLFTNAGMVQFKKVFLGLEDPGFGRRATTSQKCVRAGGKHNDLEQVGHTYRHHTFFEMLGNFSFGDYFKREAIGFAWEFVTRDLGIDPKLIRVSVHYRDDEARTLWREIAGLPDSRIYGLGDKDNFWQMADTGPCGPCSELYVDLAFLARDWKFPEGATGEWTQLDREEFSLDAFVEGAEAGRFLEIWNLVFMQFDRQLDGTLVPLPKPSVDTGAGLERIAAALQGVTSNYHTDIFRPLLQTVSRVAGFKYGDLPGTYGDWTDDEQRLAGVQVIGPQAVQDASASFRVIADHARAVAFLLADGVFPSNEGRGYVLRRILRRAVRHAWLLGRREPTLRYVVQTVIDTMGEAYPELRQRAQHVVETTAAEEERFLDTIEGGMRRFDEIAPVDTTQGSTKIRGTISGEDAFRLYDTFGFPIDLTELMARERGYTVDIAGFEAALEHQRAQSRAERSSRKLEVTGDALADLSEWRTRGGAIDTQFVGYDSVEIDTQVTAVRHLADGRVAVLLRETPFYAESGGQISDRGEIVGAGWRVDVDEVRKVDGRIAALGRLTGEIAFGPAIARVPSDRRRDTERNHTATHLLHAALRQVLGEHVHQAGSVVEPDRLRFDFTHHGPVRPERLTEVEDIVNRAIWAGIDVRFDQRPYKEAIALGAMALFGEKYGDIVRIVSVPGVSVELCGGTHVRNTAQIGLFKILRETGVAAGVRRIEAATGRRAFEVLREREHALAQIGELLKVAPEAAPKRVQAVLDERRTLERRLEEAMRAGGDQAAHLLGRARTVRGRVKLIADHVEVPDRKALESLGDALRELMESGVAAVSASLADGKTTLLVTITDDLRARGLSANDIIKRLGAETGIKGGGKPHMAQAGVPDSQVEAAVLERVPDIVRSLLPAEA